MSKLVVVMFVLITRLVGLNQSQNGQESPLSKDLFVRSYSSEGMGAGRQKRSTCDCFCGIHNTPVKSLIQHGMQANWYEFPWIAAIYKSDKLHCGGVLITDKHVLTAAHCVYKYSMSMMLVVLGVNSQDYHDEMVQKRKILRATYNKYYDQALLTNDVGLIELYRKVHFSSAVKPACLPLGDYQFVGWNGTVAGWGRTEPGKSASSNDLMKVDVFIMKNADCKKTTKSHATQVTAGMICTGYVDSDHGPCAGDSGGPLHVTLQNGLIVVIGLVSWGVGPCASANTPAVFTRVSKYLEWIDERLGKYCRCVRPPRRKG